MAAFAPVGFLLGEEEKVLITTLDTVEVIIYVEQADSKGESRYNRTLHLTSREGIENNTCNKDHLNDRELGDVGHRETNGDVLDFLSGFRFQLFLGVSRHFIIY